MNMNGHRQRNFSKTLFGVEIFKKASGRMEIFEDADVAVFDLTGRENFSLPLQGLTTTVSPYIHWKLTDFLSYPEYL